MALKKEVKEMSEAIKSSLDKGKVSGEEMYFNAEKALEKSLAKSDIDLATYQAVLGHHTSFVTALADATGDVGIDTMKNNDAINDVVIAVPITENAGHTARIARCHEPVEGKPQYGHIQINSAFSMGEEESEQFKAVCRIIAKKAKEAFE